ncbi:replication initiation protein [Pelagovum pacificum]|nr:replication initiation protein [Pelagovum pacificum]QQA45108.1 replication initiation protein [Pelagovum pacificum]
MLIPSASNVEITPAMLTVLWGVAHEIDRLRLPPNYPDAKWLEIPTRLLRNPEGRSDNVWLKSCLRRLMGVELEGGNKDTEWGAVVLAQWEMTEGGSKVRLLIPPAAIAAIRAPKTFAKIEITAAYRLKGHARRLYAALADKKRMGQTWWEYTLPELQTLFDLRGKYSKWYDFSRYVLTPAIAEINDFGTVEVTAMPVKFGRSIGSVRFDWRWKDIRAAEVTDEQNERHGSARHKDQGDGSAPPLTEEAKATERQSAFLEWSKENKGQPYSDFIYWYDSKH